LENCEEDKRGGRKSRKIREREYKGGQIWQGENLESGYVSLLGRNSEGGKNI